MTMTTSSVECMHCGRTIGNLAGLSAHMRSMHPDKVGNPTNATAPAAHEAPPESNGLVWEDPPPPRTGKHSRVIASLTPLIIELKRNPGKWARLLTLPAKSSANSTMSRFKKTGVFSDIEFTARVHGTGSALYGRYIEAE